MTSAVDNHSLIARISALSGRRHLSPQQRLLNLAAKGETAPTLLSAEKISEICRELTMHYHQMGIR